MAKLEITLNKEQKDKLERLANGRKPSVVIADMIESRYRFEIERREHAKPRPRVKRRRLT